MEKPLPRRCAFGAGVSDGLVDLEVINDGTLQDLERALRNALPIE